jgi:hypothetical protein
MRKYAVFTVLNHFILLIIMRKSKLCYIIFSYFGVVLLLGVIAVSLIAGGPLLY